MSKSRNKKWYDQYDENNFQDDKWRKKREARQMKAKFRRKNLEFREEEEDSNV